MGQVCGKSLYSVETEILGVNGVIEVGRDDKLTEGKVSLVVSSFAPHKEIPFGGGGATGYAGATATPLPVNLRRSKLLVGEGEVMISAGARRQWRSVHHPDPK